MNVKIWVFSNIHIFLLEAFQKKQDGFLQMTTSNKMIDEPPGLRMVFKMGAMSCNFRGKKNDISKTKSQTLRFCQVAKINCMENSFSSSRCFGFQPQNDLAVGASRW
jgi:hypothetical protein